MSQTSTVSDQLIDRQAAVFADFTVVTPVLHQCISMLTGHPQTVKYSELSARWREGPCPTLPLAALPRLRGTICLFSLESVSAHDCQAVRPIPHMCLNTVKH